MKGVTLQILPEKGSPVPVLKKVLPVFALNNIVVFRANYVSINLQWGKNITRLYGYGFV